MLSTLKLSNFKGHRDIEINFDDSRLHAIVGQNSSGKTSILQGCLCIYQTQNYQIFRKDLKGFGANIDDRGNIDDRAKLIDI
jgi:predicted ATP-dependent endonuclease of OLD family